MLAGCLVQRFFNSNDCRRLKEKFILILWALAKTAVYECRATKNSRSSTNIVEVRALISRPQWTRWCILANAAIFSGRVKFASIEISASLNGVVVVDTRRFTTDCVSFCSAAVCFLFVFYPFSLSLCVCIDDDVSITHRDLDI